MTDLLHLSFSTYINTVTIINQIQTQDLEVIFHKLKWRRQLGRYVGLDISLRNKIGKFALQYPSIEDEADILHKRT